MKKVLFALFLITGLASAANAQTKQPDPKTTKTHVKSSTTSHAAMPATPATENKTATIHKTKVKHTARKASPKKSATKK